MRLRSFAVLGAVLASLVIGVTPATAVTPTQAVSTQAAGAVCDSWTDYVTGPGTPYTVRIPSRARNDDRKDCTLRPANAGAGVFILQDALIRCYGQRIAQDGHYGAATRDAVKNVQRFHGLTVDGVYGPKTRSVMTFSKFRLDTTHYTHCW